MHGSTENAVSTGASTRAAADLRFSHGQCPHLLPGSLGGLPVKKNQDLSFELTLILTARLLSESRCWNSTKDIPKGIKTASKNLADLEIWEESKDFQG